MSTIKKEILSRESSPPCQDASLSQSEASLSQSETSHTPLQVPVPSFIQASDGGLVAGTVVLAGTVFGPYRGSIRKDPPRQDEKEETVFKIQDSAGQAYVIDVDNAEGERPWWACIKQTTEHSQANVTLFSHDGALYLKFLTQIPKSVELQMIMTIPREGPHTTEDNTTNIMKSTPNNDPTPMTTPLTTPPSHPASTSLEGPPFKCKFCCIEFRNPSNLDAHRVYYCPGTATKPLPSSRRRATATTQSPIINASTIQSTPVQTISCREAPATKVATMEMLKTFVCQLCQSSFESKSNCESHMLLLHCDESAKLCKFCNFISADRKGLCQHVFSHVREMTQSSGDSGEHAPGPILKMVNGLSEDDGDEKENRYDMITASKSGNNLQNDLAQSAPSPCIRHVVSSPSDRRKPSNLSSSEITLSLSKEERCSSAKLVKAASPNGVSVHNVAARLSREPTEEDVLSCPQCDFVTSRESVLLKHVTHHNNLRKKTHDRTSSADIQVQKVDERDDVPNHSGTKCHQCNIVFMSKKNYAAHKQYYCASRHADSISPTAKHDLDVKSGIVSPDKSNNVSTVTTDQTGRNIAKKTPNGPDKLQEPCSSKIVSPCCSPFNETGLDNSPRNGSLHRTSQMNMTLPNPLVSPPTTRSSPDDRLFDRPLRMIHLDGGKPQFLPPGTVLQGPQLVLVTPVVIPRSLSSTAKLDSKLKISSKTEQPLDLSTKPKTPPLSDLSESDKHKVIKSSGLPSQVSNIRLLERQANRCEECEISFSKKESLVVHKQYYCASRHVFTPRGLVRTKQYSASKLPTFSKSQPQSKSPSPEQLASRSSDSDVEAGYIETHKSQMKPKITDRSNRSPIFAKSCTVSVHAPSPQRTDHTASYTSPSQHSNSSTPGTPSLPNGNTPCEQPNFANTNNTDNFNHHQSWYQTHKLKRAALDESTESDRERSLPPIKRKRNHILDGEIRIPSTVTSNSGQLSNGISIKQEPKDSDSVTNSSTCAYSKPIRTLEHPTKQSQHPTQNTPRRSSPSPKPHMRNSPTITQTGAMMKQEPHDDIPTTNGHSVELPEPTQATDKSHLHVPTEPLRQESVISSVSRNFASSPSLIRHPISSATPLTIPLYRHSSSRQAPPARHMTVTSYLNTGTSRPLLRGVKPTVKHCRNCNISFSSLSTFIAHKKYYCASHHQTKNAAT